MIRGVLVIKRLMVENANSIAGFTWGFPAITNFLGFVHALSRKLPENDELQMDGCAVICHGYQNHVYRSSNYSDYVFSLTRNPLKKDGKTASFAEEGKMHMEVSLIIPLYGDLELDLSEVETKIEALILKQRLAGGTIGCLKERDYIKNYKRVQIYYVDNEKISDRKFLFQNIFKGLLPGFVLIHKADSLGNHFSELQKKDNNSEMVDAWLDFSAIKHRAIQIDEFDEEKGKWEYVPKPENGWLVPIPIGYRSISRLYESKEVENTRDNETPFRFVEWAYSIGEWKSLHRIDDLTEIIWKYDARPEEGWYLCENISNLNNKLEETK